MYFSFLTQSQRIITINTFWQNLSKFQRKINTLMKKRKKTVYLT